jgi:pyruvate/2-oxoglutarate/acetoin dehydrogenase E1 component
LAKIHYESGGAIPIPMVVTTAIGGGYGEGAQHSQTLYGTFAHLPGTVIACVPKRRGLSLVGRSDPA